MAERLFPEPCRERDETEEKGDALLSEALMTELVRLRKKRKIGQGPVAEAMGISQGRVSQLENLKRNIHMETVLVYAKAIGCKIVIQPETSAKRKKESP